MTLQPSFPAFEKKWRQGENQLLHLSLNADLDTPVSLYLRLCADRTNSFLLESVTGGEIRGRYSILGVAPDLIWRCVDGRAAIAQDDLSRFKEEDRSPVESLRTLIANSAMSLPEGAPPMAAGLFGYLGYDMIRLIERLPEANPDSIGVPDAILLRPSLIAIVDNVRGDVMLAAPAWHRPEIPADEAYRLAEEKLVAAREKLRAPVPAPAAPAGDLPETLAEPVANVSRQEFLGIVERAREYIAAGDIFQVVPSQRWSLPFPCSPFSLYRALRRTNPSPYMFYFDFGSVQLVGASPEILVRSRDRNITVRPLAGTRPRGANQEEDARLEAELLADPKERAEHLMLLDLGRNDVGRVAKIGSVRTTEQFTVERYSHVMHIVSNVEGELRDEYDALDALLVSLPAGTVSGAPKIRAMEIIDELENVKRGVYAGAVGYLSANGDLDTCIVLRTAILKDGVMHIQAGVGVVHDSRPEAEFDESVAKTDALRRAASDALAMERDGGA